ncbi:MAG: hypothetical protein AB9903_07205 [Vulcanimicrobiota bacterium]
MRYLALCIVLLAGIFVLFTANTVNSSVCAMEDGNQMIAQAAGAKLEMSDIIIRKKGKEINLRTVVTNVGGATAAGLKDNLTVYLYVKDDAGNWKEVKKWSNAEKIVKGEKNSRDYTPVDSFPEFKNDKFTVKAEIKLAKPIKGVTINKATIEKSFPEEASPTN